MYEEEKLEYFVDKENQKIRLHPENKTMKDIMAEAEDAVSDLI